MPSDPRTWTQEDVDRFAATAEPDETVDVVLALASEPDSEARRVLRLFLTTRHESTYLKAVPSRAAVHALVSLGEPGVRELRNAVLDDDGARVRYKAAIVEALFAAGRGQKMPWAPAAPLVAAIDGLTLSPEAIRAAEQGFQDLVAESLVNPDVFWALSQFIWHRQMAVTFGAAPDGDGFAREVVRILTESSIRLSRSLLDDFESLLATVDREETYQRFLAENPVFLDPLSREVRPKQRLGLEFATDYAIKRLDGRWLLVEIEKPHDAIFTRNYDFTAQFTHAFGQVLDFQHWVDDHVAYAQDQMPGITAPRGLLVIGLRSVFDERAAAKLRRFVDNSSRIDVVTFDDLLTGARNLYDNLHQG